MKSVLSYVRNLLGWNDDPSLKTSFKRDRADYDFSFDDEAPALKRLKHMRRTSFPDVMTTNDLWEKEEKGRNVRYVPIQVEPGHPSTSTPNDLLRPSRFRMVPVDVMERSENGPSTPARKPRMHTPVWPVTQTVEVEDDEDVTWVEARPEKPKKQVSINLDDYETDDNNDDDEVIFVKKVHRHSDVQPRNEQPVQYYKLQKNSNRNSSSPKTYSKFKAPPGITKAYKKAPPPVSKWMLVQKTVNNPNSRNKCINLNGNNRSTISQVFNLDEKRNYQELIRRVAESAKPKLMQTSDDYNLINLVEDSRSLQNTLKSQRQALNEINLVERGMATEKKIDSLNEYDPITVASINSSDSEIEIIPSGSSTSSVRIEPVNSLKESFRDKDVTKRDWLAKLDSKYKKMNQHTQEKLKDVRRESDIISKVNHEQKIAHLEHKLKYELSIPESLIEEPQPTVELPKLTPEQEKLVDRALGPGPPNQLLVEKFNLRIHRRDLQTLSGLNWLNDEVINFYMNLLMQRSEQRPELPRVYATNTFFYPKLMQGGQAGLRRWTRKVDIFSHDVLVVPVHLGVHWCLMLVLFREKRVHYLDSMGGRNQPALNAMMQYLRDEHQDKKGQAFDDQGWRTESLKDIPQQMNGSDCGMFACTFAEFTGRGAPYTFTQAHMPYLRRKAALEILMGKLLL